jgi:nickel-dependent lactate racemase
MGVPAQIAFTEDFGACAGGEGGRLDDPGARLAARGSIAETPHRLMAAATLQQLAPPGQSVTPDQVRSLVAAACPADAYRDQRVVLVVPDGTRTAPIGLMFKTLFAQIGVVAKRFDVLFALGTHPAMAEDAIHRRLDLTPAERASSYADVGFINHEWDNPAALRDLGTIPADEIEALSGGLFTMAVPVHVNRRLFDYDQILLCGPVFPHEVAGVSGGNKYLFPGVAGPSIVNFFHWLGAVVTSPRILGEKQTPVRRVIDRASAMVTVPKLCFCLVVRGGGELAGLYAGAPERAWEEASELSRELHITYKDRAFHTVLSCAPPMYDELWVGAKCMYKLEPVVADGGELIVYAPHLQAISRVHGRTIERVGYHSVPYFLSQWGTFKHEPWGVLAHSTHVHGIGTYDERTGVEKARVRVTLATGIPEATCRRVNLGYRDPRTVRPEDFAHREAEGVLLEPRAGEHLYHLRERPPWAGGERASAPPMAPRAP